MRRIICFLTLLGISIVETGCIVVASTTSPCRRQVVAVDGQLYLVDTDRRTARRVDDAAVSRIEFVDEKPSAAQDD
jgi:hypothetical protein